MVEGDAPLGWAHRERGVAGRGECFTPRPPAWPAKQRCAVLSARPPPPPQDDAFLITQLYELFIIFIY